MGEVVGSKREWSLEAARGMLPEVRERTGVAVAAVDALSAERNTPAPSAQKRESIDTRIRARVSRWVREMEALGVEPKGLWLIDFDNGCGCYCWRWPEDSLEYFHGHDEGFAGRIRIQ